MKGNESQTEAGAYFLVKLQAGGFYRGGAYKKACKTDLVAGIGHLFKQDIYF